MNKISTLLLFFLLGINLISCGGGKEVPGTIAFVKGDVKILLGVTEVGATLGQKVSRGNAITTGPDSVVIIKFEDGSAQLEVQSDTRLIVNSYTTLTKDIYLERGNVWTSVEKVESEAGFVLRTPTSVAGVRGTKFYTFNLNGISGICFCEGQVKYSVKSSGFDQENNGDFIAFTKGKTTVIVTQADLQAAGLTESGHNHSQIPNSSLGPQNTLNAKQQQLFFSVVQNKFAEAARKTK